MTCQALIDQIADEKKGQKDYFELMNRFPTHRITLESFRMDEKKHQEILEQIMDKEGC